MKKYRHCECGSRHFTKVKNITVEITAYSVSEDRNSFSESKLRPVNSTTTTIYTCSNCRKEYVTLIESISELEGDNDGE